MVSARIVGSCLLLAGLPAACAAPARQDPLLVRGGSVADAIPTLSVQRTYAPARNEGRPDSQVAYGAPDAPSYRDRPLDENLRGSIELADYVRAMERAGLMALLDQAGPFTVFAIPNIPMEAFAQSANAPSAPSGDVLRQALGYSVVRGAYPAPLLRRMIATAPHGWATLRTVGGGTVLVGAEPGTGRLVLSNGAGQVARVWIEGLPQSNGVLYLTQSLLPPAPRPG
ncbi:fasciclin domain-containing protein [Gluconacetobacter diazotrophicus]|uniref:FAS1 domain-containing protein n=2 Tax=Gluconacetobacter diazotrophicus TaxID=33996 RepID=A0A7W4FC45_GLUDI|nr:fasciclin domain-containing protein [Gluconacetobacter diazotrophicus]MBB2155021.1 hypothetical protein [Gluconacetobacter diazotrophicus]CAP54454.1 putative cell adhesion [Gluconacetobacter diazotrophicus PA1 5]